jgi:Tfp pilus assembly protein PilN
MAQQINLFSPILLAPRRHFSAFAMLQGLGVLCVVLFALCAWVLASSSSLRRELQSAERAQAAERDRLTKALAVPAAASGVALEQELVAARQSLATRRALLDELTRGRSLEGRSHASMLRMVAQTAPAALWLTEVRLVDGRLELKGKTLQPEALRPWITQLAQHPLTADQRLAAMKVERDAAPGPATAAAPAWSFQLVSQTPSRAIDDTAVAQGKP